MSSARLKGDWTSWRDKPRSASRSDETEKRTELWESLNAYCREHRGWIVSPPGARTAVLETERGSELPQKLAKLGYAISELPGTYERLTGVQITPEAERLRRMGYTIDNPGSPITLVDRYEIVLPWAAPPPPPMKRRPV